MKDDTIKRSNVIDAVKIILDRFSYKEYSIGFKWAMSVIETIPSADRPQEWIPCSERLPEEHEWIGTKEFGTTISDEVHITFDVNGERFVKTLSLQNGELSNYEKRIMDSLYKGWKMVAWMPLPEPWKGANDDYERAVEQMEYDMLYEPTYNPEDGSM